MEKSALTNDYSPREPGGLLGDAYLSPVTLPPTGPVRASRFRERAFKALHGVSGKSAPGSLGLVTAEHSGATTFEHSIPGVRESSSNVSLFQHWRAAIPLSLETASPLAANLWAELKNRKLDCLVINLTFRTSAFDYLRISLDAKLRGAVRCRPASPRRVDAPPNGGCRGCLANSGVAVHAVIRKVGQQRGLHSSREDLGTNLISILELVTAKLDPSAGLVLIGLATRYSWNHA